MNNDHSNRGFYVIPAEQTDAQQLREHFEHDTQAAGSALYDSLMASQDLIPESWRAFTLIFPRAISPGLSEGGGADRVTDDSLKGARWDGTAWIPSFFLAGKHGWGVSGPRRIHRNMRVVMVDRPDHAKERHAPISERFDNGSGSGGV